MFKHIDLVIERDVQARPEIGCGQILLHAVGTAVEATLAPSGQVQNRLAQGLGRDRAGVNRNAADPAAPFDDQDIPSEFRRLNGSAAPRRPAADHDQIVVFHYAPHRTRTGIVNAHRS